MTESQDFVSVANIDSEADVVSLSQESFFLKCTGKLRPGVLHEISNIKHGLRRRLLWCAATMNYKSIKTLKKLYYGNLFTYQHFSIRVRQWRNRKTWFLIHEMGKKIICTRETQKRLKITFPLEM